MIACFKASSALLAKVRIDLARPHSFAWERVGFISAGIAITDSRLIILARDYRPVEDGNYLDDHSVGAMMGPEAIRSALQWAMNSDSAMFHVHTHEGCGVPWFSRVDLTEQRKFVPDFFKVAPRRAHGAIVLSNEAASGRVWLDRHSPCQNIQYFVQVGVPIRKWTGS